MVNGFVFLSVEISSHVYLVKLGCYLSNGWILRNDEGLVGSEQDRTEQEKGEDVLFHFGDGG